MAYDDMPQSKVSSKTRHLIKGLRDYAIPSEVKVYKMNPDGSKGE